MAVENLTLAQFYGTQRNPFNYVKVEQINRDITTGWLTLEEITQQINLYNDESQDSYLEGLELAVRMAIEDYLGLTIFPITYRVYYGNTGLYNTQLCLDLPEVSYGLNGSNAVTINSVKYYADGSNNTTTTLATDQYYYDATGNRVIINAIPQTLSQTAANPIIVEYAVSPNFIAQYPVIKQAGLLLFTHLYNNRSNTTEGVLHDRPFGIAALLRPYKPLVM